MNIDDLLSMAIGQEVVHSRTGGAAGSIWSLRFNDDGMGFMIDCAWRVERDDIVLTTCNDDGTPLIGHMNQGVKKLEGSKFLSYELSPHYDLTLYFENNFIVRVFCNIGYEADIRESYPMSNWDFSVPSLDISVTVTDYFQVVYTRFYSNDFVEV